MKAGRSNNYYTDRKEPASSFYGKHHNIEITLKPEFSTHAHAPISDSYGASESLSAWRVLSKGHSKTAKKNMTAP